MKEITLYGKDKNNGLKQWTIWTDSNKLFIKHGKVGGKLQTKEEVIEGN